MWTAPTSLVWAGSGVILITGSLLMIGTLTAVDGWYDQWRLFALQTRLAGGCITTPENCNSFEPWMIAPWGMAVGTVVATLALAVPFVRR